MRKILGAKAAAYGCSMTSAEKKPGVGLPEDPSIPFFAYGSLKPGALGHHQIQELVSEATASEVKGSLWIEDGLPLLDLGVDGDGAPARGFVLRFIDGEGSTAYDRVGAFEPRSHYRWDTADIRVSGDGLVRCNLLVGRVPRPHDYLDPWEIWDPFFDPLLTHGLAVVRKIGLAYVDDDPSDHGQFWDDFFHLEAGFLLLASVLERVALFWGGVSDRPTKRIVELGRDPHFIEAVRASGSAGQPKATVRRSYRGLGQREKDREKCRDDGKGCLECWYAVRSNIVHQGKAAYSDRQVLVCSYRALHNSLRQFLSESVPHLADRWEELDPEGADSNWLLP